MEVSMVLIFGMLGVAAYATAAVTILWRGNVRDFRLYLVLVVLWAAMAALYWATTNS